ncbi:MAG: hypothetical protein M1824_004584 [Vezdaea acicularis]|nr:MAG: hypothetical protein M1824_004584 [Vezdaea acicularis]
MANKHHDMVRDDPTLMSIREPEGDADDDSESMADKPPIHPVPCMQGAFEESMIETTNDASGQSSKVQSEKIDSATRRRILLEQEANEETHAAKWRQKPGERYHPLWKLVAQIAFGVHLLHKQMAKSDEEVIKILQTHVDEVDGFLERTTEDFDLAINDIEERMRYLKLPLEHSEVFDEMLTVREFRIEIVDGNEKIEHIINRTAAAMTDALRDIKQGLDATKELARYQIRLDKEWEYRSPELESVYLAMKGNAEGWFRCFVGLQTKGDVLGVALQQLGSVVAEIQKRAGVASRKAIPSILPPTRPQTGDGKQKLAATPNTSVQRRKSQMKRLPTAPATAHPPIPSVEHVRPHTSNIAEQKTRPPKRETRFLATSPDALSDTNSASPKISPGISQQPREGSDYLDAKKEGPKSEKKGILSGQLPGLLKPAGKKKSGAQSPNKKAAASRSPQVGSPLRQVGLDSAYASGSSAEATSLATPGNELATPMVSSVVSSRGHSRKTSGGAVSLRGDRDKKEKGALNKRGSLRFWKSWSRGGKNKSEPDLARAAIVAQEKEPLPPL